MSRMNRSLVMVLWGILSLSSVFAASQVDIQALPPVQVAVEGPSRGTPSPATPAIGITFTCPQQGNLFQYGQPVTLTAHIANPGDAQSARIHVRVASGLGAVVDEEVIQQALPAQGTADVPIAFDGSERLPKGSYLVEVWAEGERSIGSGSTLLGIWDGPAEQADDSFGISYDGPLTTERTWHDLDLFHAVGIGWLRFPLQGWLPQGQVTPPAAEEYDAFVREAGKRGFSLVAGFTPQTTVDPSVNPVQADKEYRESILAAANRYGFKVKHWELLQVKPNPMYPQLKGIRYPQLAMGREALRASDKSLTAIFTVDDPFRWNALDLFTQSLPPNGDVVGMHYDLIGIPETPKTPTPSPLYSVGDIQGLAKSSLKRIPPLWVTEYGLDPTKKLPPAVYQAALMARAAILSRAAGIERIFWRHMPDGTTEVPFTSVDGGVQPSLLALRTTLSMLHGASAITQLPTRDGTRVYLVRFGEVQKKRSWFGGGKKDGDARYMLVAWTETDGAATGLSLQTGEQHITVTDLWGNRIELNPVANTAIFPVDECPRFVDLGKDGEVDTLSAFARFDVPRVVLRDDAENRVGFTILNDQRLFGDSPISCELVFRRWPVGSEPRTKEVALSTNSQDTTIFPLSIPAGSRKGLVYEVSADIMIGSRRIGYLSVPVWYLPKESTPVTPAP